MSCKRKVDCVILAGGFGTRLKPLTDSKPKPLMKILDTAVLCHVVSNARKISPHSITVSTGCKGDMIDAFCKSNCPDVVCKREMIPLGTAGGVKNCCGQDFDALLVLSGDAFFDFDLKSAVDFHFENQNDVTIVTSRKENPTEYGVVITDDEQNIISFCEKPGWNRVRSDLVNTGIYLLSKRAVDSIPDGFEYDFSKNLFPRLMKESARLKSFYCDGFWCDIGTIDEYYMCNRLAASGKLAFADREGCGEKDLNLKGIHAEEGVYVSKSSSVGKNVRICNKSVVCSKTVIGDNCDIVSSVIGEGSRIGCGSSVAGAIIGENVCVGENCIIPEGTVIGDLCRIADGAVVKKGTCVASGKCILEEDKRDMSFSGNGQLFKDDGLAVFDYNGTFTELAAFAYSVSCALRKNEKTPLSFSVLSSCGCVSLKGIICSGLVSNGEMVFDCGEGNEALCSFAVKKLETDAGIYLSENEGKIFVRVFSDDGGYADDTTERKISNVYTTIRKQDFSTNLNKKKDGSLVSVEIKNIYENSLLKYAESLNGGKDFSGTCVCMTQDSVVNNVSSGSLCRVLELKNCEVINTGGKDTLFLSVSEDGKKALIRCGNLIVDHYHICAAVAKNRDAMDFDKVSFSNNMPMLIRDMLGKGRVKNSLHCITDDGVVCILTFLCMMHKTGESINELFMQIPPFEIYADEYIADVNRASTMERLSRLYHDSKDDSGDGICLHLAEGNVTVIPNRAKGFKIVAEAQSMEAAKELSVKIGKAIKNEE